MTSADPLCVIQNCSSLRITEIISISAGTNYRNDNHVSKRGIKTFGNTKRSQYYNHGKFVNPPFSTDNSLGIFLEVVFCSDGVDLITQLVECGILDLISDIYASESDETILV